MGRGRKGTSSEINHQNYIPYTVTKVLAPTPLHPHHSPLNNVGQFSQPINDFLLWAKFYTANREADRASRERCFSFDGHPVVILEIVRLNNV